MAYGRQYFFEQANNFLKPAQEKALAEAKAEYEARHFFDGVNLSNKCLAEKKAEAENKKQLSIYLANRAAERAVLRAEARKELLYEMLGGVICSVLGGAACLLATAVAAMI